ncbi:Fatty acyl-CoA reductase 2 [Striga hermonthica]|uniref:Fatty acyl-CoA reductase n=1 Tax=Striga hermonthica TaxID=68872 RepID=A0A9N7R7B0_STRHE|nr:Fatty acyl-CoA reductase 2 [Striga hermonthica]
MSTAQISTICIPQVKLFSHKHYQSQKPNKISFLGNNCENSKLTKRLRDSTWKLGVNYNGYAYFTSPLHPLEAELPLDAESGGNRAGVGIDEFFQGKNIFVTGATGLVGKALVEKLLRSTSVRKIYLLMKANDKEGALERLSKDIIQSELFECLWKEYGSGFEELAREKLVPIVGNICKPNLGMDAYSSGVVMDEVDVIVGSAASTTLDDRYDSLIDANVSAPQRLMRFAKKCKNLKLFVHISTAYVNGRKEGIIYEKPLVMGGNGRNEEDFATSSSNWGIDLTDEMNLVMKSCIGSIEFEATKELKRLGLERAAFYGWYNPYHSTKAMGEMVLNEIRENVPVLIIRPTVIESSYEQPFPGWIQGNRMFDPVIISYGKGLLPAYLADPNAHVDIVPVDMVANTTIAAIAKHGSINKPRLDVYHVATDFVNPLKFSDFFEHIHEHFTRNPLTSGDFPKMELFDDFSDFSMYVRDVISERTGLTNINAVETNGNAVQKIRRLYKAKVAYAEQLCKLYEFIGFFKARFHTGNTRKLLDEMSKEEQDKFEIDATKIDWRKYFVDIHIPGVRKHVLNNKMTV